MSTTPAQKEEIHALCNVAPLEIVNVSYDADENFLEESGMLTHMIGVLTTATRNTAIFQRCFFVVKNYVRELAT